MLFDCPRCGAHLFFAHAPDCPGRFDWAPDACAFCGKVEDDVDWMVGEPGRRICGECVDLCRRMLEDATAGAEASQPREDAAASPPAEAPVAPAPARAPPPAPSRTLRRRGRQADHCAYCGRHKSDIVRLIAGPKVSICDTCVHDLWVRMAS